MTPAKIDDCKGGGGFFPETGAWKKKGGGFMGAMGKGSWFFGGRIGVGKPGGGGNILFHLLGGQRRKRNLMRWGGGCKPKMYHLSCGQQSTERPILRE